MQQRSGLITLPCNVIVLMKVSVLPVDGHVNPTGEPPAKRSRYCGPLLAVGTPAASPLLRAVDESGGEERREGKGNSVGPNGPLFICSRSPYLLKNLPVLSHKGAGKHMHSLPL